MPPLTAQDRATYEWQMWIPDFGERGQQTLKGTSVLISRCGGVGGAVAYYLAMAGIGRLVLAHKGNVKPSDLNRQILMTHDWLGKPRVESAARRLNELNPDVRIESVQENISDANAERLVGSVDLVVDCAPRFEERFAMNRQAVRQHKPLVECAMYELEGQITSILPGQTPCLACLYPDEAPAWRREFPVFGAVAGTAGCMGAMEAIKVLSGLGRPLAGEMLRFDLRDFTFRKVKVARRAECPVCGEVNG